MSADATAQIENTFLSLSQVEREAIITHGAAMRLSSLKQRLFLAQSKVRSFEEKYRTTLKKTEPGRASRSGGIRDARGLYNVASLGGGSC